jgi:hypothetical protein
MGRWGDTSRPARSRPDLVLAGVPSTHPRRLEGIRHTLTTWPPDTPGLEPELRALRADYDALVARATRSATGTAVSAGLMAPPTPTRRRSPMWTPTGGGDRPVTLPRPIDPAVVAPLLEDAERQALDAYPDALAVADVANATRRERHAEQDRAAADDRAAAIDAARAGAATAPPSVVPGRDAAVEQAARHERACVALAAAALDELHEVLLPARVDLRRRAWAAVDHLDLDRTKPPAFTRAITGVLWALNLDRGPRGPAARRGRRLRGGRIRIRCWPRRAAASRRPRPAGSRRGRAGQRRRGRAGHCRSRVVRRVKGSWFDTPALVAVRRTPDEDDDPDAAVPDDPLSGRSSPPGTASVSAPSQPGWAGSAVLGHGEVDREATDLH